MATFMIKGHTTIDVNVKVEADTLEEAIEIVDSDISFDSYIDGSIGISYCNEAITNAELCDNSWLEWDEEFCGEI